MLEMSNHHTTEDPLTVSEEVEVVQWILADDLCENVDLNVKMSIKIRSQLSVLSKYFVIK